MSEWIDLKEQRPEKDGRYIVCVPFSTPPWIGVSSLRNGKFDDVTATHWMVLPSAPTQPKTPSSREQFYNDH